MHVAEQHYPEPTVRALIVNPRGELFLMRSHKWRDQYVIPGGHIELGETMEAALRREIAEETGLDVYDIEFLAFQEFIYDDAFWQKRHFIFFDFVCRTDSREVTLNEEGQGYIWASAEEALSLPIEPYTRRIVEVYMERQVGRDDRG
jgi:nucleoside triphosphatase